MSYILDALKKSEQERGHGTAPGIQTMHSSSMRYAADKRPIWPFILITVVAANLAFLMFLAYTKDTTPAQPTTNESAIDQAQTQHTSTSENTDSIHEQPTPPINNNQTTSRNTTSPKQVAPQGSVIHIHELPLSVKQQIPAMDFSAHIYSSNPKHRSIVINGSFMEEGEQVSNELTLTEITSKGAIFSFRGYRFRTEVVSSWDIN